jgi:hypothetical protein
MLMVLVASVSFFQLPEQRILDGKDWFSIELRPLKNKFVQGEPVYLTAHIVNKSETRLIISCPRLEWAGLKISGPEANAPFLHYERDNGFSGNLSYSMPLDPGESYTLHGLVVAKGVWRDIGQGRRRGEDAFPRPGTYRMRYEASVLKTWTAEEVLVTVSNTVEVAIDRPTGRDVEAYRELKAQDLESYLSHTYWGHGIHQEKEDVVKHYCAKYGNTTYGPHMKLTLGTHLMGPPYKVTSDWQTLVTALDYLEAAAQVKDHPMALDALFFQGCAYRNLRNLGEAKRCFKTVIESGGCRYESQAISELRDIEAQEREDK